jgi:hypothetical protein
MGDEVRNEAADAVRLGIKRRASQFQSEMEMETGERRRLNRS